MKKPKTTRQVSEMIGTGKTIDAAVARATHAAALAAVRPKKVVARSPRPRSKKAA